MQTWDKVMPAVQTYIARRIRDDERRSVALVLAWWKWSRRKKDFPPGIYAWMAVQAVWAGRDLPGVQPGKTQDAWDHLDHWQGAGMGEVVDRRPGPDLQAEWAEQWELFTAKLTERERQMVLAYLDGHRNQDVARRLNVSPGRATQLRQSLRRLLK